MAAGLLALPASAGAKQARAAHAVIISIDGLRADAVRPAWMPVLIGLAREGATAPRALCALPPVTVPNHVSMVTGLPPSTHRVLKNSFPEGRILSHPSIFTVTHGAGLTSGLYVSKMKLAFLADPKTVNRHLATQTGDSAVIVDRFISDFQDPKKQWSLSFIHLVEPDRAGHESGWMSQPYADAVCAVDRLVDRIVTAIRTVGLSDQTLILVTADHGGLGNGHDSDVPEVRRIPWIARGPGITPGTLLRQPLGPQNIAPTVLLALGLDIPGFNAGEAGARTVF